MILQNRKQTNSSIAWSIILINKIVDLINLDGPIYQPCSAEWPQTSPANCCVRSRSQLAEENMFESHSNIQSGILSLGEREHVFFTLLKGIKRNPYRSLLSTYMPLRTFIDPTDVRGKCSSPVVSPPSMIKLHTSFSSSIHFPSKKGFS